MLLFLTKKNPRMYVDLLSYFLTATKRAALHLLRMSQISRYLSVSSPNSRRLRDKFRKPKLPLRDLKWTNEGNFRSSWSRGFRMDKPFYGTWPLLIGQWILSTFFEERK
jgi:hypothetical protein